MMPTTLPSSASRPGTSGRFFGSNVTLGSRNFIVAIFVFLANAKFSVALIYIEMTTACNLSVMLSEY
jgi:hypothetical protein